MSGPDQSKHAAHDQESRKRDLAGIRTGDPGGRHQEVPHTHSTPMNSPVATTLCRSLSLGVAKPVQPSSSRSLRATRSRGRPAAATAIAGDKDAGDVGLRGERQHKQNRGRHDRSGQQRDGIPASVDPPRAHPRKKFGIPRSPRDQPSQDEPATGGPSSSVSTTSQTKLSICRGVPGIPPGPPTSRRTPPQEMTKTTM